MPARAPDFIVDWHIDHESGSPFLHVSCLDPLTQARHRFLVPLHLADSLGLALSLYIGEHPDLFGNIDTRSIDLGGSCVSS